MLNRTQVIGIVLFVIGVSTHMKKSDIAFGALTSMIGIFLIWNGWVAEYNQDIGFAMFG